jgi:hypothetical protein
MKNSSFLLILIISCMFIALSSCGKEEKVSDSILSNNELSPGQYILSKNSQFKFIFQEDGNCVIYKDGTNPVWNTKSIGAVKCVMQEDGNFVLYDAQNKPLYDTQTFGNKGSIMRLEDDGNLIIIDVNDKIIWESKVTNKLYSENEIKAGDYIKSELNHYRLYFQDDGNLVLYFTGGIVVWSVGSFGATKCILQSDGNLVLYDPNGNPKWNSNSSVKTGKYFLALQVTKDPVSSNFEPHLIIFDEKDGSVVKQIL